MIGDWYYWEAEGKKYPLQVTKDTFKLSDEDISNFQPIPLTQEILEKNGFEDQGFRHHNELNGIDDRVVLSNERKRMNSINEWHVHIDSEDHCIIASCELTYVHELQHLLKLCKINKEIVV